MTSPNPLRTDFGPLSLIEKTLYDDRARIIVEVSPEEVDHLYEYTVRADGKRTAFEERFWFNDVNTNGLQDPEKLKTSPYTWGYINIGRLVAETIDHWDDGLDQVEKYIWINKYVSDVRGNHLCGDGPHKLFLATTGKPQTREGLALIVRQSLHAAGIEKRGACHLLRHTAATLLMENGTDLRALQVFLGREKLDATQIYTHMTLGRLQQVHQ